MKKKMLLRSMMYMPGYKEKYFDKLDESGADAVILDLEDSVPARFKPQARENVKNFLKAYQKKKTRIFVRLNSIESRLLFEDLQYVLHPSVDGYLLTKIYTSDDMVYYDKLFTQLENEHDFPEGSFDFVPLIETPSAVLDIYHIAVSTKRIVALAFGGEDFLNDMGGYHGAPPKGLDYPRSVISLAARAADVLPIDTPYLKVKDEEGFRQEERTSFEIGFAGIQCLHPFQVSLANEVFMPTEEEIQEAKRIIAVIDESSRRGTGVAMLGGNMIGPPMEKRVRKVLDLVELSDIVKSGLPEGAEVPL